ncbi:DUF1992 domain-containing protein [Heliobacterium undosum]|uniref:DUF1992 domain-containing protein n=1 Tax=Heliomicrobium undosum TaxID=121734 RepID=A0A845L340_9FIRM|nr:DUF1992 domain-containing protein [Heliomicrobium undosum]MZP31032.1 DUF1992 domain-containing protein [Heliomicrobium undosum]
MFEKLVEAKIQEAMRNGEFDNLPLGKPIDLDYWASLPEDIRAGYMLLKNAGYAPEEVQLVNDMGKLREQLAGNNKQDEKAVIIKMLKENELKYNIMMEVRNRKKRKQLIKQNHARAADNQIAYRECCVDRMSQRVCDERKKPWKETRPLLLTSTFHNFLLRFKTS